jgi:hypothetical protein
MENPNVVRLYDGKLHCGCGQCSCPVADYDSVTGMVTLTDPDKPQNGTFVLTAEEYNAFIGNALPVA